MGGLDGAGCAGTVNSRGARWHRITALDAAIVAESLGAHIAPTPLGSAVIAPTALIAAAGDHGDLLAAIAAGTHRVGMAFGGP